MNTKIITLLLMLLWWNCNSSTAQSNLDNAFKIYEKPYAASWQVDAPITSISLGLMISQMIMKDKVLLNLDYVQSLQNKEVNHFDGSATKNYSLKAKKASDYLMYTSMSAPMLLLADPAIRADWQNTLLVSSETFLVGMGITLLVKNLAHRPRPFLYNENVPMEDKLEADGMNSFLSGHTSMTALSTFMMASMIIDYHPHTKLKPLIWTTATAIPFTTGLLRYSAGKHFFTDIIAGFAVGALTGYFVPYIHEVVKNKRAEKSQYVIDYFGRQVLAKELL